MSPALPVAAPPLSTIRLTALGGRNGVETVVPVCGDVPPVLGRVVVVDVLGVVGFAADVGPLSLRSPIWRRTMPMTTATPINTAPSSAAYPAPRATSPLPPL